MRRRCSDPNNLGVPAQALPSSRRLEIEMESPSVSLMLKVQEKKSITTDLYRPLRHHIAAQYSEHEAQLAEADLQTLRKLRADLENPPSPLLDARRDLLQAYFSALSAAEARLPHVPISFTWHDAFNPGKRVSIQSIQFERAAVLFNLGAVWSQMAIAENWTAGDGLKKACNAFQAAAGVFRLLKENAWIRSWIGASSGITVDLSLECLEMLEKLMLAQAQECFFEKVITDGKPHALCSKVSSQVAVYYEQALEALSSPPLNQHFQPTFICHVNLKAALFSAEACYWYSLELHEKEDIAEEIARLNIGISALVKAKKDCRGVAAPLLDAVSKLLNRMNLNLERAVKENNMVYLMRVPAASSLSTLPAVSLVKPMPMTEVLEANTDGLFLCLLPASTTESLSKYAQMVNDIIQTQCEKMEQASEILKVKLKEMDLPDSILDLEGNLNFPLDLKEGLESVQLCGGLPGLEAEMQQLRDFSRVNLELLAQTEKLLQEEEREDALYRSQFGAKWSRPRSSTLSKNMHDRLKSFAGNLKQANDSDARIERILSNNFTFMAILGSRPVEAALPSLARPIMSLDGNEDAVVGTLKESLRQLEALGTKRACLKDMLEDMKNKDDILPKLMKNTGPLEILFKNEVSKYGHICEEIDQNVDTQEQLLLQIQAQNAEFIAVFNLEDYRASREKSYKQIAAAVAKYQEIKEHLNKGLNFYITLKDAITSVKQQCSDFAMTRKVQCNKMIEGMRMNPSARQSNQPSG
ncbi:hypothetical protein J5N97_021817 [Dioscorea zingiberensis]|uniref:BRO1 domain-containing protein n=1 Tax=Dioscorea zingiberensis TaxID=325984 RepID=A0A9D5HAA0_9LILI|nr:hypothetical protein J5N97_021817 [Dioscorea zingiberensis]